MKNDEMKNDDDEYMELVPVHLRKELSRLLESSLSLREKWEIAKAKAKAVGYARMVVADFLIEEGLMQRRLRRKE